MKNEEKLSNLLKNKSKKPRSVDKNLDSSVNIFPLNQKSIPELVEQKEKPEKLEKKKDYSAEFADLKQVTKKYLDKIYSVRENNVSNNNYTNNVRIFNENPDYYSSNFQRTNNLSKNESLILSKNSNISKSLVQNENTNDINIDRKNTNSSNFSNTIDFIKNENSPIDVNSLISNSTFSVKTPTFINKPVISYDNLIEKNTKKILNTTFQSNKEPKRFQQNGINLIKLPYLPNPIPTFAEGGVMDVKGPQLIEVGSDKNNAPMTERIMAFSKPTQSFVSGINPLNIGKNLSSLMKSAIGGDENISESPKSTSFMSAINPLNVGKNLSTLMKSAMGGDENISESPKSTALSGFIEKLKDPYSADTDKQNKSLDANTSIFPNLSSTNSNNVTNNIVSSNINTESTLQTVLRALDYGLRSRHKIG